MYTLHFHVPSKRYKKENQQQTTLKGLQNNRTCANILYSFHTCTVYLIILFKRKNSLSRHEHQDHNEIHTCKSLIRCDKCDTR